MSNRISGMITAEDALDARLADVGLARDMAGGSVAITGEEGAIASPHRLATAAAVAAAAQGTAIAAIWRQRSGAGQNVSVDLGHAGHAVNPSRYILQHGHSVGFDFTYPEPGNGYFVTADDRRCYLVSTRPNLRNGLLEVLDCANTPEAITKAVLGWKAEELEQRCAERSLPVTMVRSPEEWRSHPQGIALSAVPVIEIEKIADGAPQPFGPAERPLSGIRVLDASHILAGPGLARTLAEQGADALRISAPCQTDPLNFMIDTGFGKRAAFLDLDKPEGVERARELAGGADVVVQSYSPGSMARRGLSAQDLALKHRGLVYVSLSCFGAHGPWSQRVGFDHNSQSVTGISFVEGGPQSPRLPPTTLVADYITAYLGTVGTLAALLRRANEGGSYHVKVSLARTCMWIQDLGLLPAGSYGHRKEPAPVTAEMDTAFGHLRYLAPITQFSATPAFWSSGPVPLGASRPEWLS